MRQRPQLVLTLIVLVGLVLRVMLFAVAWGHPQRMLDPDSFDYLGVGQHFSQAVLHNTGPLVGLSVFRTPGYPAFVALLNLLSPSLRLLVFAQILLTALTTLLVYRVTKLLFDESAALIAALIVAIDPASVIYSNYVLTESLAALLLILGTWVWLEAVRTRRLLLGASAGIVFAAAAFVRPIGLYIPIVLVLLSLLIPRASRAFRLVLTLVVIAGFAFPVGSWMVRNRHVTGSTIFSSIQGYTLLYYTAASALATDQHLSLATAQLRLSTQEQAILHGSTNEGRRNSVEAGLAVRVVRMHLLGTIVATGRGAALMVAGPGQSSLDQLLSGRSHQGTPGTVLLPIEVLVLALILIGAMLGVWRAWVSRTWRGNLWIPLAFIGYFLVFSAGPAYSRFRVPIMPFIAALSGLGWSWPKVRNVLRGDQGKTPAGVAGEEAS